MGILDKLFGTSKKDDKPFVSPPIADKRDASEKWKEKYKIMEQEGMNISWWEFEKTVDEGWPYPVSTRGEMCAIEYIDKRALSGHVIDISHLITAYHKGLAEEDNNPDYTIFKDEEKKAYWKNLLIDGANKGNRAYQAALVATNGLSGLLNGWLTQEEHDTYTNCFLKALLDDAGSGDPEAQYAVAEYCLGDASFGSELRIYYVENAMKSGVTDAAFLRGKIYETECYTNGEQYDHAEKLKFYLYAVNNSSGSMLEYMREAVNYGRQNGII